MKALDFVSASNSRGAYTICFIMLVSLTFTVLTISYSIYHIHEHLNSSHVPVLVSDFANSNHIQLDHMNDNDGVPGRIYLMVILLALSIHWNHLDVLVMLLNPYHLMTVSLHLTIGLQLFQMVLCIHSKLLLLDHYLAPNMMVLLSLLYSLKLENKMLNQTKQAMKLMCVKFE